MKPSRLGNAALTGAVDTSAITAAHANQHETAPAAGKGHGDDLGN